MKAISSSDFQPSWFASPARADVLTFMHYSAPGADLSALRDPYLRIYVEDYWRDLSLGAVDGVDVSGLRKEMAETLRKGGRYVSSGGYDFVAPPLTLKATQDAEDKQLKFVPLDGSNPKTVEPGTFNTLHYYGYTKEQHQQLPRRLGQAAAFLRNNQEWVLPRTLAVSHADIFQQFGQRYIPDFIADVPICTVQGISNPEDYVGMANKARELKGREPLTDTSLYGFVMPTEEFVERCMKASRGMSA